MLIFDPPTAPPEDPDLVSSLDAIAAVLNRLLVAVVVVGTLLGVLVAKMV